jgi:uncharacterized membrane protein
VWLDWIISAVMALAIAWLGYRAQVFTRGGAGTTVAIMLALAGLQGWVWTVPLAALWGCVLLVAAYSANYKRDTLRQARAYHLGWDAVLCRLGWPLAMALLDATLGHNDSYYWAFLGGLAVAAADISASELGLLSADAPHLIVSGRPAKAGQAGAISVVGSVAGLGAAWLIGLAGLLAQMVAAWLAHQDLPRAQVWLPLGAMVAGAIGSLLDSFLGATAQAIYYCEACDELTEDALHHCGTRSEQLRGWPWLSNAVINGVSSVVGAAVIVTFVTWLAQSKIQW